MTSDQPQPVPRVNVPAELTTGVYANLVDIKSSVHDYVLTFFRFLTEDRVGMVAQLQTPTEIRAVSRVVIPSTLIEPLLAALNQAKANREQLLLLAQAEQEKLTQAQQEKAG